MRRSTPARRVMGKGAGQARSHPASWVPRGAQDAQGRRKVWEPGGLDSAVTGRTRCRLSLLSCFVFSSFFLSD